MVSAIMQMSSKQRGTSSSNEGPLKYLDGIKTPENLQEAMRILKRSQRDLIGERSGPHWRAESHRASMSKGKRMVEKGARPQNRPANTCNTACELERPHHHQNRREETPSLPRGSFQQSRQAEFVFNGLESNAPLRPRGHRAESNSSSFTARWNLESSFEAENDTQARHSEELRVSVHTHLARKHLFGLKISQMNSSRLLSNPSRIFKMV